MYMQMDNQLTPSQRFRLIRSGPIVEQVALTIIMETATKDYWELEQFLDAETRTFTFKVLCIDDPDWSYDEIRLEEWIGFIRYFNTVFPQHEYQVKVYLECFTVEDAEQADRKQCVRRDLEWFLEIAALVNREEHSIVVAPPHPEADPNQFEQWSHWIDVYNAHAHEVDLMEYSAMLPPVFL